MNQSTKWFLLVVVSVVAILASEIARAQEATAKTDAAPPPTAAANELSEAATQTKAVFDARFNDYKEALRQIEVLRTKYQAADAATREKLNADLTAEVAHTQSLVNALVEAAEAAFRAAPNSDQQVTDLLMAVAQHDTVGWEVAGSQGQISGGDQYERALPIIKLLTDGGVDKPDLYVWGFLSAFATNDYDLAETYFEKAKSSHAFAAKPTGDAAQKKALQLASMWASALDHYRELWAKESAIRAAEATADDLPRVKLTTTKGTITIELFENEAPQSVANFLALVKQGFYDGSPFHRVIAGFMAQGGAKDENGQGGPGYCIRSECKQPNARQHFRGSLSMAHKPNLPDSGSSQFFLTFVPTPHLDGEHTVFGRVIDGFEVLGDIVRREPNGRPDHDTALPKADRILKGEVLRNRGHEYKFEKLPES